MIEEYPAMFRDGISPGPIENPRSGIFEGFLCKITNKDKKDE